MQRYRIQDCFNREFVSLNSLMILCLGQTYLEWTVMESAFVGSSRGETAASRSTEGPLTG